MKEQQTMDGCREMPANTNRSHISVKEKICYGLGSGAEILMANLILKLALPVYNLGLGVSASLVGMLLMSTKIFDAVIDPVMGHISDNSRLRWGRRKPFIIFGAILAGLLCVLMWRTPQDMSVQNLAWYFAIITTLFYMAYTVFYVPYNALGYEMTDNYDERTRVMTFKWGIGATISLMTIPVVLPLCYRFNPDNAADGARIIGPAVGFLIILLALPAGLVPRERKAAPTQIPFGKALTATLKNRSMLLLCGVIVCCLMGMMMLISWLQFLNMTYIYSMNQQHSANMVFLGDMVFSVLNIGFMFAVSWLATRLDKRTVLVSGLVTMSVGVPLSFFYITPIYPILQLLWAVFLAPGMAAVWLLTNSCIADVCDEDELCTGARREGFYGAVYSFSMKAGAGVGLGIAGILLDLIGFDKELIEQSHETILKFRWTFAVIPAVFFALAAWMAALYPITRMRHDVIKQQLTMKKNEIGVNP